MKTTIKPWLRPPSALAAGRVRAAIVFAALTNTSIWQDSSAYVAAAAVAATGNQSLDLSIEKISAPIVAAPPGLPPFPQRVDLPVSLSRQENTDDSWTNQSNYELNGSTDSMAHAVKAKQMLQAGDVVNGFRELRKAVELNNWAADGAANQAECHRKLGDILMEYACKAKDTGRGTRGMQRLLNSYIEYRQAIFLNPADVKAQSGLVKVTKMIAGIVPSFNNYVALGSAELISGNRVKAEECYQQCLGLARMSGISVSLELLSEIKKQTAKLEIGNEVVPADASTRDASTRDASSRDASSRDASSINASNGYVNRVQAISNRTNSSVSVPDYDTASNADPYGSPTNYTTYVGKLLEKEWRLSHFQTARFPAVRFSVNHQGDLSSVEISMSSGNPQIDSDAMDVVRRVAPFPKAPDGLGQITYQFGQAKQAAELQEYMHQLRRKIRHNWRPPHDLQEDHMLVSFRVNRDGSVDAIEVTQPSASEKRNQAALGAIRASAPFQHLPDGTPPSVSVQFHFDHLVAADTDI